MFYYQLVLFWVRYLNFVNAGLCLPVKQQSTSLIILLLITPLFYNYFE